MLTEKDAQQFEDFLRADSLESFLENSEKKKKEKENKPSN